MRRLPRDKNGQIIVPAGSVAVNLDQDAKGRKFIRQERKYELITPLFGGGVEPGVNDELTPITGKAIRGHLRFWWRATRGGRFGGGNEGLRKMKEWEDVIWGAASTPSQPRSSVVQIAVVLGQYHKVGQPENPAERRQQDWKDRFYAAFPFQDNPQSVQRYRFDITLSFPETISTSSNAIINLNEEIDAAIWAWQTLGGVGARTRRGFGALRRIDDPDPLPKDPKATEQKIREGLAQHVAEGEFPPSVPHLSRDMSFVLATTEREVQIGPKKEKRREPYNSYDEAWEALIVELKSFRQARTGTSGYGRSKWNEPERIRDITKQRLPAHTRISDLASIEAFPRAAFGQPILFQFKRDQKNDSGSANPKRDPVDTTLKGGLIPQQPNKSRERLASPLILRPLACSGKAVGLAAILKTNRIAPEGLYLTGEGINEKLDLNIMKKDAIKIEPLRDFASKLPNDDDDVDVLEAFVDRFRPKEKKK